MADIFDVIIIGAGITGTSLLYMLSRFTNVKSVLLIEKYEGVATLNSSSRNNSQTLHFGDIETNYSLDKARKVKTISTLTLKYCMSLPDRFRKQVIEQCPTMVLAVGSEEVEQLKKIYESGLREVFPTLQNIDKGEIGKLEPNITAGRDPAEEISAITSGHGYMVNFGKLAETFIEDAKKRLKSQ